MTTIPEYIQSLLFHMSMKDMITIFLLCMFLCIATLHARVVFNHIIHTSYHEYLVWFFIELMCMMSIASILTSKLIAFIAKVSKAFLPGSLPRFDQRWKAGPDAIAQPEPSWAKCTGRLPLHPTQGGRLPLPYSDGPPQGAATVAELPDAWLLPTLHVSRGGPRRQRGGPRRQH